MDPATVWLFIMGAFAVAGLLVLAVRTHQRQADEERRTRARDEYAAREAELDRDRFLDDIDRYFPFVREPFQERVAAGQEPETAFMDALEGIPAVRLGTTFFGLPALLPLDERRKHLYIVGKTGSGKTSLMLHLIQEDLDAGRGVGVIAPEAELFRDWILPLVPKDRVREVIYFAPGNPGNTLTFNPLAIEPGDDQDRAAGELFAIFKRAIGDEGLGARMGPILGNAFATLTGRPGATLWDVKRILEDRAFREELAADTEDIYVREFWLRTYPGYPKGAHLPVINRLDQFLRPLPLRRALCHPTSSFSIRQALAKGQILLFDLSGLAPDNMLLLGQMLLSKFQLELMRREVVPVSERQPFYLYADEFQTFAGVAEGTWRELLSRGRRYGLALTLANQYPSQLPQALQNEIFGNVASMVALNLGAKDAQAVRREFLERPPDGGPTQPIRLEALVELRTGRAMARLGGGAYALPLAATPPLSEPSRDWGRRVRQVSWSTYAAPPAPRERTVSYTKAATDATLPSVAEPVQTYQLDDIEDEVID